jgi:2,4-dienoyl-CoA reductase-like NADH-dependent reductase (Old Yellow Enzyme family)
MPEPLLFSPLALRSVRLKNRVVVAPMHQYSGVGGFATDWHLMNAGKFAAGGAGLVMMESTKVERRGCGTVGDLGLWKDEFIAPLRRVADFIKSYGAAAGIQLGHSGRKARAQRPWEGYQPLLANPGIAQDDWESWELVAPSALPPSDDAPVPRALGIAEIADLVQAWGAAARRADDAGFDVLEIHAAHGYLIHQFLSPQANRRNDQYGGSEEGRMRFAVEVAECVRANWPAHKPLFMRFSVEDDAGWGPEQSVALARLVKAKGVDVIDCSSGGMAQRSPLEASRALSYGYQVPYAEQIRREADIKTMAVGLIIHADQAEAILQKGQADLIALARELLYNPNWPMDAAQKLGIDPAFASVPSQYAYWLAKRARSGFAGKPSTWGTGSGGERG